MIRDTMDTKKMDLRIKDVPISTMKKWKALCGEKTYREKFKEVVDRLFREEYKNEFKEDWV